MAEPVLPATQACADVTDTAHGLGLRVHRPLTQRKGGGAAVFGDTKSHQVRTVPVPDVLASYAALSRPSPAEHRQAHNGAAEDLRVMFDRCVSVDP